MRLINVRFLVMGPVKSILYGIYLYFLLYFISFLFTDGYNVNILTIAIVTVDLLSFVIEYFYSNPITRFSITLSEIIKWLALMYGMVTFAIYIIQIAIPLPKYIMLLMYLAVVLVGIYAYINAHRIIITEHDLEINNLCEELTIIHISDLHIGSIRNKKLLTNLINKINSVSADIVIISGDLADGYSSIKENMFITLKESKIPIFFVFGNHDYYRGIDPLLKATEIAGIKSIINDKIEFKGLNIFGLPYSFGNQHEQEETIKKIEKMIDSYQVNILVYHVPINWEFFRSIGFDIQLSGHTHGGQFYPMTLIFKRAFPYLKGLFKDDNTYLSVTDGVGTGSPPLRLGTHSEIVLLHLKKSKF
ncbi:MAG: metallophosphoesterase [Methanobrevibacter sp.]|jgi:predicted MPP superfamily phosphohydrolase|nr:metallophosphoesterase [Candidatus Methanovirga basalitermitum]